jgi:CBS domain containing-hemolysin-like protein
MLLLVLIVTVSLSVSFLCSILEASLLSASLVELSRRRDKGDRGAARLLALKEDRLEDSIAAILTYNTIAHTVGAALAGAQAAVVFGDAWVGVFSGVLTLLILVITEIIPKTIGTVHAERLAGVVGRIISLMLLPPMRWILFLTRALTRLFTARRHRTTTRGDVLAMLKIATRDGALRQEETRVLANFLRFDEITVGVVMTPRTVVTMFEEGTTLQEVLADPESRAYSRFPIYNQTRDHVTGYVLVRAVLRAVQDGADPASPVSAYKRPLLIVSEELSVGAALREFTGQKAHLAVVTDELGVVTGLVTMEDLVETALGVEIVDELDRAVDLRKVATELRDRRLAGMRQLRLDLTDRPPGGAAEPD